MRRTDMRASDMHAITLVHPAPYRAVPARARVVRTVVERVETPARIREAAPSEMRRIGTMTSLFNGRTTELHEHEGETWTPFMGPGGALSVRAENLLAFLRGEPVLIGDGDMPHPLVWTPLHAWQPAHGRAPTRGAEPVALGGGRIVEDGRDRARSEAAAWVERELRICDGRGWIRLRGPMAHAYSGGDGVIPNAYQASANPMRYASDCENLDVLVAADAIEAHSAFRRELEPTLPFHDGPARLLGLDVPLAALPGANDDALAIACGHGLTHVIRRARATVDAAGVAPGDRAPVEAAFERLAGHAMRAVVSGVRPDEFGEVLQGMDGLLRAVLARVPEDAKGADRLRRQHGWLTGHLLPRAAAPTAEADEGALMGLGR